MVVHTLFLPIVIYSTPTFLIMPLAHGFFAPKITYSRSGGDVWTSSNGIMVFNNNIVMHLNNCYFLFLALLIFFLQARFFLKLYLLQSFFLWVVHTFFLDHSWSCFGNHKCWLSLVVHFLLPSCSRSHFGSHPNWFFLGHSQFHFNNQIIDFFLIIHDISPSCSQRHFGNLINLYLQDQSRSLLLIFWNLHFLSFARFFYVIFLVFIFSLLDVHSLFLGNHLNQFFWNSLSFVSFLKFNVSLQTFFESSIFLRHSLLLSTITLVDFFASSHFFARFFCKLTLSLFPTNVFKYPSCPFILS